MTNRIRALFAGDVSIDLTMRCSHVPAPDEKVHVNAAVEAPGGVAANAAVACALAGTATTLMIATGDDEPGERIVSKLQAYGVTVDTSVRAGPTCRVVVLVEPHGEKRLLLYPGVSMYPARKQIADMSLHDVGWFHTAVYHIPNAEAMVERCREQRIPWSLDLEPSTFPGGIGTLSKLIDGAAAVFCNLRASAAIGPDAAGQLLQMGAASVVETMGHDGARLRSTEGFYHVPAPRVAVIDTTGAGDCFAGWYVAERLQGESPEQALRTAVEAAAMSCRRLGAQSSYPSRAQLAEPAARHLICCSLAQRD